MAIKQPETLSRADFDQAVVRLRLNVSEVAKETGVPRTYLSEFRNGDRQLRPEHQARLRDYFESKGIQFEDEPLTAGKSDEAVKSEAAGPHPRIAVGTVCFFPIRPDIAEERVREVMAEIERNDELIAKLVNSKVVRNVGLLGDGELSDESQDNVRELFARYSANYLLVRYLTGVNNPLAQRAEQGTLQSLLLDTLKESLERAGINVEVEQPADTENEPEEEEV